MNQPTLKLSEGREDVKYQLARWAGCVDEPIADGSKADATIAQLLDQLDQVMHRSAESVESPDDKRVTVL